MWINCDLDFKWNTEIKYKLEDGFFYVEAESRCVDINENTVLVAYFEGENPQRFEIGEFIYENEKYILKKKYSLPYLESVNVDVSDLSHFSIDINGNGVINAYPAFTDKSILRAKEILSSIKGNTNYKQEAAEIINNINHKVLNYRQNKLPFLNEYTWYAIDDKEEYFNASSVNHILKSDGFNGIIPLWYLGKSTEDRLYAIAVRCDSASPNPMSNANDCTLLFSDEKNNCIYYVVGIMFLDDGQYFCRLN